MLKQKENGFTKMHLTQTEICQYAEALVEKRTAALPVSVLNHCEECFDCKREVLNLVWSLNDIGNLNVNGKNTIKKTYPQSSYLGYMRAAVILLAITLPLYVIITNITAPYVRNDSGSLAAKNALSGKNPHLKKELREQADRKEQLTTDASKIDRIYEPIPRYESISGDVFRSAAAKIVSPANGLVSSGAVKFRFSFGTAENRYLRVLNNSDIQVYRTAIEAKEFELDTSFGNGLYYWKLETEKDLIYLGKFLIK